MKRASAGAAVRAADTGEEPKTRQELDREVKKRGLPGPSKMGRDELERALRD